MDDYLGLERKRDAAHFFSVVCPRVFRARSQAIRRLAGRFGFQVSGTGGGEWLLDFPGGEVRSGALAEADVTLALDAADFTLLLKRKLPIASALAEGRLRITGKTSLLPNLQYAFLPS